MRSSACGSAADIGQGPAVLFQVASFEDLAAPDASFDLVISGAALADMWAARDDTGGAWVKRLADTEVIDGTGLFGKPVRQAGAQRIIRPADAVIGMENTRATSLSWPDDIRQEFTEELRHYLGSQAEVHQRH